MAHDPSSALVAVPVAPGGSGSVGAGAFALAFGRIVGMGAGFVLVMILSRRAEADVGVFRTLVTFMVISEFLPLLGVHRWLGVRMGTDPATCRQNFSTALVFSCAVAVAIALVYGAVSVSGLYGPRISTGLLLVALATMPSAALLAVQASLIGMGHSRHAGMLTLVENLTRSVFGVLLLLGDMDVLWVIGVFAAMRWAAGFAGVWITVSKTGPPDWRRPASELPAFLEHVPRFVSTMVCFLVIRYAATVMLPSLTDTRQAGLFSVCWQLLDLSLLVPTALALSATRSMSSGAARSRTSLHRSTTAALTVTAIVLLPLVSLAIGLASPLLMLLFGAPFASAALALTLLMLAAPLMALDQVLSQMMVSVAAYRADLRSVVAGAVCMVVLTAVLADRWGANGAAAAVLVTLGFITAVRLHLLRPHLAPRVLFIVAWRPALAGLMTAGAVAMAARTMADLTDPRWSLLMAVPGAAAYLGVYAALGGLRPRQRARLSQYLRRKG